MLHKCVLALLLCITVEASNQVTLLNKPATVYIDSAQPALASKPRGITVANQGPDLQPQPSEQEYQYAGLGKGKGLESYGGGLEAGYELDYPAHHYSGEYHGGESSHNSYPVETQNYDSEQYDEHGAEGGYYEGGHGGEGGGEYHGGEGGGEYHGGEEYGGHEGGKGGEYGGHEGGKGGEYGGGKGVEYEAKAEEYGKGGGKLLEAKGYGTLEEGYGSGGDGGYGGEAGYEGGEGGYEEGGHGTIGGAGLGNYAMGLNAGYGGPQAGGYPVPYPAMKPPIYPMKIMMPQYPVKKVHYHSGHKSNDIVPIIPELKTSHGGTLGFVTGLISQIMNPFKTILSVSVPGSGSSDFFNLLHNAPTIKMPMTSVQGPILRPLSFATTHTSPHITKSVVHHGPPPPVVHQSYGGGYGGGHGGGHEMYAASATRPVFHKPYPAASLSAHSPVYAASVSRPVFVPHKPAMAPIMPMTPMYAAASGPKPVVDLTPMYSEVKPKKIVTAYPLRKNGLSGHVVIEDYPYGRSQNGPLDEGGDAEIGCKELDGVIPARGNHPGKPLPMHKH